MRGESTKQGETKRRAARQWRGAAVALATAWLASTPAHAASLVAGPDFSVVVTLSPKAAARLANPRETVVVAASFYGIPKAEKLRMEYQGQFPLAADQNAELSGAGVAHFVGPRYDRSKLRAMQGGALMVTLQIFSGRHSSPDNLLDCTAYEASVELAARKPVEIQCKLIAEQS